MNLEREIIPHPRIEEVVILFVNMFQQLLKVPLRQLKILPTNISLLACKKVRNKYLTSTLHPRPTRQETDLNHHFSIFTSTEGGGVEKFSIKASQVSAVINQRNKKFYSRRLQVISGIKIRLRLPEDT